MTVCPASQTLWRPISGRLATDRQVLTSEHHMTGQTAAVSVTVISYNAADTIEETLDSVLKQDLPADRIELLISDDASRDATVAVARQWLAEHGARFHRTQLIANEQNGGVSANCNTVWQAARGEWVKVIAADDILRPNCLSDNLRFAEQNPDASVIASSMRWFGGIERVTPEPSQRAFFELSALDQYRALRFGSFNFAPTSFIRREALIAIDYADARYRNIEDLPLWLRFTKAGFALRFNDSITVDYRVSDSISKSSSRIVNLAFLNDLIDIHNDLAPLPEDGLGYRLLRLERSIGLYSTLWISKLCGNRRSIISRSLQALSLLLRPTDLWGALRRRAGRLVRG